MLPLALFAKAALAGLILVGAADMAHAHGDYDARPRGELTGEAPEGASPEIVPVHVARPAGELTANWPEANSPEAVHLVHGDYDWIRRGGYKGVDGSSCCGKDDCDQIPSTRVERTPEGYRLHDFRLFVPNRQAQTSEDGKFWLCRDQKVMRCFFAPPPGS